MILNSGFIRFLFCKRFFSPTFPNGSALFHLLVPSNLHPQTRLLSLHFPSFSDCVLFVFSLARSLASNLCHMTCSMAFEGNVEKSSDWLWEFSAVISFTALRTWLASKLEIVLTNPSDGTSFTATTPVSFQAWAAFSISLLLHSSSLTPSPKPMRAHQKHLSQWPAWQWPQ